MQTLDHHQLQGQVMEKKQCIEAHGWLNARDCVCCPQPRLSLHQEMLQNSTIPKSRSIV